MYQKFFQIAYIVTPIFLTIAIGYLIVRIKIIEKSVSENLSNFTFYIALPILLFNAIINGDILHIAAPSAIAMAVLIMAVFIVLAYLIGFFLKLSPNQTGVFCQAAYRPNIAYIALPVCVDAFGNSALAKVALLIAFVVPVLNVAAVLVLTLPMHNTRGKIGLRNILMSFLKNPLSVAAVAGIIFSLLQIKLPAMLAKTLEPIGKTALPLSLISVGCSLHFSNIGERLRISGGIALLKLFVLPLLTYTVLSTLGFELMDVRVTTIVFGAPTAVASYIMARNMNADQDLAADAVMISTLLSMISIPAWLFFLL